MDVIPWLAGAAIVVFASILMWTHANAWKSQQADDDIDQSELPWFRRRFRRRMQASGLLLLIGGLIPIGDQFLPVKEQPTLWAVYWLLILLGLCWVVLLAVGDLASTNAHSKVSTARVARKRRELEQELERLRNITINERN